MIPISLTLSNFMLHCDSHIDFEKLGSVFFIIGSRDDSTRRSNAVGKSTIFHAIRYVLFNVGTDKKITKVIRRGEKKCEVTFVFQMSDGNIYKIYRYRTEKTANVNLYKKDNGEWVEISGRRPSDTDETIEKIIGINLTTFENTSYFKQEDLLNLAKATPEKRKEIISSMLELGEWDKYKEAAKETRKSLGNELSNIERQLTDLGSPETNLLELERQFAELQQDKQIASEELDQKRIIQTAEIEKGNSLVALYKDKKQIEQKYNDAVLFLQETKDNLSYIDKTLTETQNQIASYTFDIEKNTTAIAKKNEALTKSLNNMPPEVDLSKYEAEKDELAKQNIALKESRALLRSLKSPLPKDAICPSCTTELSKEKRQELTDNKNKRAEQLEDGISNIEDIIHICEENIKEFEGQILKYNTLKSYNGQLSSEIIELTKNNAAFELKIEQSNTRYNDLLKKKTSVQESVDKAQKSYEDIKIIKVASMNNQYSDEINKLRTSVKEREIEINKLSSIMQNNMLEIGKVQEKIDQNKLNIIKVKEAKLKKEELANNIKLYDAAIHAFSSKGIPFMIINSVLGAIQDETNKLLQLLRNNMLTQFVLDKQKDNESQETLDMKFYTGKNEWEYSDLSGGQKGSVALALKVAMAVVSRKRCGTDIKMLLLDEVDQPLDDESVDSFFEILKAWSKDMTIMVITHRSELKAKLASYILVTDRNDYVSAKAVRDE